MNYQSQLIVFQGWSARVFVRRMMRTHRFVEPFQAMVRCTAKVEKALGKPVLEDRLERNGRYPRLDVPLEGSGWDQCLARSFQTFFIFTPKIGEDEPILTNIFSKGLVQPPTRMNGWVIIYLYKWGFPWGETTHWSDQLWSYLPGQAGFRMFQVDVNWQATCFPGTYIWMFPKIGVPPNHPF